MGELLEQYKAELSTLEGELTQDQADRKNWLSNKISEIEYEQNIVQARVQTQEEKINSNITFSVDGVDMSKLPAEMIKLINIIVKYDRKNFYEESNKEFSELQLKHRAEIDAVKEESLAFQKQCREAMEKEAASSAAYADLKSEFDVINAENNQYKLDVADLTQRLKNATAIIDEKDKDIERLNRVISDNAASQHFGERAAQQIIDITPDAGDDVQGLVNAIAAQFAGLDELKKNTDDFGTLIKVSKPDGSFEVMKRDQYEKVVNAFELPEVQPVGASFPVETTSSDVADAGVPFAETVTVDSFRPQEVRHMEGLDTSDIGQSVPQTAVTRQEFEAFKEEVKARFESIIGEVA